MGIHDACKVLIKRVAAVVVLAGVLCAGLLAQEPAEPGARGARGARGAAPAAPINPTNSPDGRWTAAAAGGGPWTFEFKSDGATLSGSVRQTAPPQDPIAITEGRIDGTRIRFKITSPDGARTITFLGRVSAGEISFVRQFETKPGGSRGGNDLYGQLSSLQFVARRAAQ